MSIHAYNLSACKFCATYPPLNLSVQRVCMYIYIFFYSRVYLQQSESKKIYIITRNNNIMVNTLDTVALHNSELLTL